jgi:hypothetical protein
MYRGVEGALAGQYGADPEERARGLDGGIDRRGDPGEQLLDHFRGAGLLVVLHVVQDDQVRAVLFVLQAAQALAPAPGLEPDVGEGDEIVHRPVVPDQLAEITLEALVVEQLQVEIAGEVAGQVLGVGGDDDEVAQAVADLVDHVAEGGDGGLGELPGRGHHHGS